MSMSQKLLRMLRRALSICLQNQQSAECNRQVKHDQIVRSVSISVRWNFLVFLASMDSLFGYNKKLGSQPKADKFIQKLFSHVQSQISLLEHCPCKIFRAN